MSAENQTYNRFNRAQRIEHAVLIASFTLLALTGLPQKYPLAGISQGLVTLMGGIDIVRIIHRISATVFVLEAIYHVIFVGYFLFVKRRRATMLPSVKDGKDAVQFLTSNLGITKEPPRMPRFNFMEKIEYWAMIWGLLLMGITGFMLWNPIATSRILPGVFIPAAKVAHGMEAVLAVLAILLWHFYNVHIKQFNKSMFTGKMTRHEMEEEHGHELELIESGAIPAEPPTEVVKRRQRLFIPFALVVTAVLVSILVIFVTYEDTALDLETITPVEDVEVFELQTPTAQAATPTLAPTSEAAGGEAPAALTWDDSVAAVFDARCSTCHGSMGGFNAQSYDGVMEQITPGDPDGSGVIQTVSGTHPGQFDPDELELIVAWIEAGAPEQ